MTAKTKILASQNGPLYGRRSFTCSFHSLFTTTGADKSRSQPEATRYKKQTGAPAVHARNDRLQSIFKEVNPIVG